MARKKKHQKLTTTIAMSLPAGGVQERINNLSVQYGWRLVRVYKQMARSHPDGGGQALFHKLREQLDERWARDTEWIAKTVDPDGHFMVCRPQEMRVWMEEEIAVMATIRRGVSAQDAATMLRKMADRIVANETLLALEDDAEARSTSEGKMVIERDTDNSDVVAEQA